MGVEERAEESSAKMGGSRKIIHVDMDAVYASVVAGGRDDTAFARSADRGFPRSSGLSRCSKSSPISLTWSRGTAKALL